MVGKEHVADQNTAFAPIINTTSQCQTKALENKEQLIIYAPSQQVVGSLLNALCHDPVVAKQYGKVLGFWGYRTADSIEFIGKGIADLTLAKHNIMSAFKVASTYNYQPVVGFPNYKAYFISAREKPRISKQYFLGKRIALLDYPTSRSGHILPKQTFKDLGLSLANLKITYASSHRELRELLANGEVDLIASFWQEHDAQLFSKNYITQISDNIIGTRWYLKMEHENTDLVCAIQTHLMTLSKQQISPYFNHVQPYWQCATDRAIFVGEQSGAE
ncbi:hypothetical protein LG313_17550 (plasmid) [Pseudoalteromonas mariniglutinosa]